MTMHEAEEKLKKVLKELEDDDFQISSVTEILYESETEPHIVGSTIVDFNPKKIKNKIIEDNEQDKMEGCYC